MPGPPYRVLRIILGIFSLLTAAGGLVIIFSDRPMVMRLFLRPPESEVSALLLIVLKEMGGLILMLSVMFFSPIAILPGTWPSLTRSLSASAYWLLHRCGLFTRWTCDRFIRAT